MGLVDTVDVTLVCARELFPFTQLALGLMLELCPGVTVPLSRGDGCDPGEFAVSFCPKPELGCGIAVTTEVFSGDALAEGTAWEGTTELEAVVDTLPVDSGVSDAIGVAEIAAWDPVGEPVIIIDSDGAAVFDIGDPDDV